MVPLTRFYSELMPRVIGCPEPLAKQALVDSAIEFCERSLVVISNLDPVTTVAELDVYDIPVPSMLVVSTVLRVWLNGNVLWPVPTQSVAYVTETYRTPTHFYGWDTDEGFALKLYPSPDKAGDTVVMRVALKPARGATLLPTTLYNDWMDPIIDGAEGRIRAIADQTFTDLKEARDLKTKARAAANAARINGIYGKAQAELAVTMRPLV